MIFLLDLSALAHRIYHTTHQQDINGENCGIPSGTMKSLARVLTELKEQFPLDPIVKVACMDFGRCAWRREALPSYKGNRPAKTDDFLPQMQMLEAALPAFGFLPVKSLNTEADDFLGVMAGQLEFKLPDECILIASSDRDLWQLATDQIAIYDFTTNMILNRAAMSEKLEFDTSRLVEYKALAGDSSDNIPGAKGIGEKGAKTLLAAYPDLRDLLLDIEAHPEKANTPLLKKVAASIPDIRLAGKLCTIAQLADELFTQEAREEVERAITWAMSPTFSADEVAMSLFSDNWQVDGRGWTHAFK